VFAVRAALPHEATVGEIFRSSVPYWVCLLAVIVVIAVYPQFATWLPNLGR
jgi:C4-dicarboxylate transporter, DctM subunit